MQVLQRNQLVWLSDSGWKQLLGRKDNAWDAEATCILQHWHSIQLPLVVCTQRQRHSPATISLGLPAPEQWSRRKLALEVLPQAVERTGGFPSLKQVAHSYFAVPAMQNLLTAMQANRVQMQVYGSFGWRFLTGLDYVRSTSDLDLRAEVPDHATACKVVLALGSLQMPLRVDGELAFPDGSAIAWREYQQWVDGKVDRLLVKSRTSVQLLDPAVLQHEEVPCIT